MSANATTRSLRPADQKLLRWGPEDLDWYDYWMNIHFPGLQKWVLPELDSTYAPKPKQVYSYHDLLEVFWNNHNPTTLNRQGPDVGAQYRSAVIAACQNVPFCPFCPCDVREIAGLAWSEASVGRGVGAPRRV